MKKITSVVLASLFVIAGAGAVSAQETAPAAAKTKGVIKITNKDKVPYEVEFSCFGGLVQAQIGAGEEKSLDNKYADGCTLNYTGKLYDTSKVKFPDTETSATIEIVDGKFIKK